MHFAWVFFPLLACSVSAYPGMKGFVSELIARQTQTSNTTVELIGDLLTIGAVTAVGRQVEDCLTGAISCEDKHAKTYRAPGPLGSAACLADTCCVWDFVSKDLVALFQDTDRTCNAMARAAVRFGFHDAGAWSKTSGFGGADGSLLTSDTEIDRAENNGMQSFRLRLLEILKKYSAYGVGAADLVQFAHNVATVVCPLGPRVLTYVGREDSSLSPTGLLPSDTHSPSQTLIDLFANKTIGIKDLIALVGAHSVANQFFVDKSPEKQGLPLDSTPGIWDVKFYSESLQSSPPPGVFRLPSDDAFTHDNHTVNGFRVFSDPTTGQATWNAFYATAYVRLSLLGVNVINNLTDCTAVLPSATPNFNGTSTGSNTNPGNFTTPASSRLSRTSTRFPSSATGSGIASHSSPPASSPTGTSPTSSSTEPQSSSFLFSSTDHNSPIQTPGGGADGDDNEDCGCEEDED